MSVTFVKPAEQNFTVTKMFRVNEEQSQAIDAAAETLGIGLATLCREAMQLWFEANADRIKTAEKKPRAKK
jgi:hypothetical protein